MNKIIVLLSLFLMSHSAMAGERWIGKCTDGKDFHYVQKYKGIGHLYLTVETPFDRTAILPIATLKQSMSTNVAICGTVQGNPDPVGRPISQVCMNRKLQIIYVKFDDPERGGGIREGKFCKADVKVVVDF